jgi:hypothetical protein
MRTKKERERERGSEIEKAISSRLTLIQLATNNIIFSNVNLSNLSYGIIEKYQFKVNYLMQLF